MVIYESNIYKFKLIYSSITERRAKKEVQKFLKSIIRTLSLIIFSRLVTNFWKRAIIVLGIKFNQIWNSYDMISCNYIYYIFIKK